MAAREKKPEQNLPADLSLLLEAIRAEFDSKLTTVKLWGTLAMLAGGTLGGVVSRFLAPAQTASALHAVTFGLLS